MKQEVINYEFDVIQQEVLSSPHIPRHDPHNYRYSTWKLNQMIERLTENRQYSIKWIGNSQSSNILAFFYCVLMGCLREDGDDGQAFIKLKYSLYQVCKEWLTPAQQKTFVQHLCLVEYSKSVTQFLKKSNHLESILIKIFNSHKRQIRIKRRKQNKPEDNISKIQQLHSYSILFPFISFQLYGDKVAKLIINGLTFHILEEKQCLFVLEYGEGKAFMEKTTHERKRTNFLNRKKSKKDQRKATEIAEDKIQKIKGQKNSSLIKSISYINVPVATSSRRNSKQKQSKQLEDAQNFTQVKFESQRQSIGRKIRNESPIQFSIGNISTEHPINQSYKPFQNIRTSIGFQLEDKAKKQNKLLQSKNRGKIEARNPQIYIKGTRKLSRSIVESEKHPSLEQKKSKSKSKQKIPKFLQKKKDMESKGQKLSKQHNFQLTNRSKKFIQSNQTIVPLMPYPMINFYIPQG